ncbi:MAG: diguanylate cyclase [Chthoniobacterales bacterium]|nr:diguanylate cyclase [Chthoniobacterales bacterium]
MNRTYPTGQKTPQIRTRGKSYSLQPDDLRDHERTARFACGALCRDGGASRSAGRRRRAQRNPRRLGRTHARARVGDFASANDAGHLPRMTTMKHTGNPHPSASAPPGDAARETLASPRAILDALLDPHLLLAPVRDAKGKIADFNIEEANGAAAKYYQLEREGMIGRRLLELLPADSAGVLMAMARDAFESDEPLVANNFAFALEIYGNERRFDIRAVRINGVLVWTWRDVTERHLAAERLGESEQRFRLLAENSSDVIARIRNGAILWISPSVKTAFGWEVDECVGRKISDFVETADPDQLAAHAARIESGQPVLARQIVRCKDGSIHWIETHASPFRDANGKFDGFVATSRIVDEQVRAEQQLEHRARTDGLTELLNRKEVLSRIEALGDQSRRQGHELGILFCDLDRFKAINDSHGHAAGDEVLRTMAERLRGSLRTSDDLAARIGGDELLVVLHGVHDLENAAAIAEKLRRAASEPIETCAGKVSATLSIGVTLAHPGESTDSLVARADAAMYRAKQSGRNQIVRFDGRAEDQPEAARSLLIQT